MPAIRFYSGVPARALVASTDTANHGGSPENAEINAAVTATWFSKLPIQRTGDSALEVNISRLNDSMASLSPPSHSPQPISKPNRAEGSEIFI